MEIELRDGGIQPSKPLIPPTPEKPDEASSDKPLRTWRPEEDRPSKLFQWAVNLPDKFTSRKFNAYQFFLVAFLGTLFYVLVPERFGD